MRAPDSWRKLTRQPITADNYDLLKQRISDALDSHDIVLINAGSSAGTEDYTSKIVGELGPTATEEELGILMTGGGRSREVAA